MGLFSFMKNAGAKLAEKVAAVTVDKDKNSISELVEKQQEDAFKLLVASLGVPVEDLTIEMDGDKLIIGGKVNSQVDREKIILTVGNTNGIAEVEDNLEVVATEQESPEPESQFYTVKSGDSLSLIAKHFYGDALKYPLLFEANKPMLKDVNLIYPGQVLRIPSLTA